MTAIVFAAYTGGLRVGLFSALLTLLYAACAFSSQAGLFHYTRDDAVRVTVLSLTMPLVVLMVGLLQGQARMHAQRMNAQIQNNSRALRQSREWLATTLQSIGDAVITTDTDGNITFMNPMAEQLTGWTEEEACEKSIETVFRVVDEHTQQPLENLGATSTRDRRAGRCETGCFAAGARR
jgi:PAS domain-containing protein